MLNGLDLMTVKAVEAKVLHGLNDVPVEVQFRPVDGGTGGEIAVADECVAKVRMVF